MSEKVISVLLLIGFAALQMLGFSKTVGARTDTGAEFLTLGIGARASGMGESFVAVADDVTAIYWNPGGLGFIQEVELIAMHSNLYASVTTDVYHSFLGYAQPIAGVGTLGIGVVYLNSGTHPLTEYSSETESIETLGEFHTWDAAGIVSYSSLITKSLSVGINFKYIYSEFYNVKARAYAADFGILFKTPLKDLTVGLDLKNLGTKISYVDKEQADILPLNLRFGVSYHLMKTGYSLIVACDINKPLYDDFLGINGGIEWKVFNAIIGRIGYLDKGGRVDGYTYGFGISYRGVQFDYANVPGGELDRNDRYSLTIRF